MILGHIGARKGSKGVPGKNFRSNLRQTADRLRPGPAFRQSPDRRGRGFDR